LNSGLKGDFEFYPENVTAWRNLGNGRVNLFEMMYNDPLRWGFSFQQYVMLTRLQDFEKMKAPQSAPIVFSERSIFSDRHVFMKNFEIGDVVTKAEKAVYAEWCDFVVNKIDYKIDGLIYLRASTQTCLKRCQKRSRDEEKCIGQGLLQ
jgi:deoxyadenosine/deoxycytidine kinase